MSNSTAEDRQKLKPEEEICTAFGQVVPLCELCEFITKGATPTTYGFEWQTEGIPFLRSECVSEAGFSEVGLAYIGEDANIAMARSVIKSGDLLITITGNVGRVAMLPQNIPVANINQHIARVRIIEEGVSKDYVRHFLGSPKQRARFQSIVTGQAYPQLSLKQIRETDVILPPIAEQNRIAEILTSVDERIGATEAVIEQAERVKRGLTEDLLTGGLGGEAIARGELPEGWKQSNVGEQVELLSGFPFKSADYSEDVGDVRLLRGDNIGQGLLRWRDAKRWDRSQYKDFEKYHLEVGDLVIAMDRTWVSGGLKVAEVRNDDLPSLLLQRVARLRAKGTLDKRLLKYCINSHRFEQYVKSVQTETVVPHISARQIKDFAILVPPQPEQERISEILNGIDDSIRASEVMVAQLERFKRGLMDDLLTGRVRTV